MMLKKQKNQQSNDFWMQQHKGRARDKSANCCSSKCNQKFLTRSLGRVRFLSSWTQQFS